MGRQLKGITGTNLNVSYKYNDSGIRTEKTVNGVTTRYHLLGNEVTFESNGTDNIYYTYDSSNNLLSMNLNGVEYYYIRNVQGDIIGLHDKSGTVVVNYVYDSWGKLISTTGTLASTVGAKNPYRYRGYRYDTETGLYYLQSRYYNSDWGRFINADGIIGQTGDLLGHNLFAYCKNNPVNMSDPSGFISSFALGILGQMQPVIQRMEQEIQGNGENLVGSNSNKLHKKSFNPVASGVRNGVSSGLNAGATKVPALNPYKFKTLSNFGYIFSKTPLKDGVKVCSGRVGYASIALGVWDAGNSLSEGKYVGAAIDVASVGASFGAGLLLEAGGAFLVATVGAPAVLVGGIVIVTGFAVSLGIDYISSTIKDSYYRRD